MTIINRVLKKPRPSIVLDTYWKFAAERQAVFFNRIHRIHPLTTDSILLKHKFTNAYRASDRVSQYLIRNVIYKGDQSPEELLFRILLFKIFNKIETWELLQHEIGELNWKTYSFVQYNRILQEALNTKESIYSGAYIMASGKSVFGYDRKHENHLRLIEKMIRSGLANKITDAESMEKVYELLRTYPTIGSFLAYQYTIDINYSRLTNFSEMDFVVPGPGAKDGIRKCFKNLGDYSEADVIRWVTESQINEFERLDLDFQDLWGRPLQLIDCQNLFCETDKYARVAHPEINGISERKRIKQLYIPKNSDIVYWYPPKWNINPKLSETYGKTYQSIHQPSESM
ncbi:nucleotide kinase domain-containing protein [Olivibacter oleidegradans]|uniref:Nucleotide kinase domain-containing protein n=1 Tax=Olivibacter oleidegradans TaxID=760123 RepID=A0ABV6HMV5_9SPHI